MTPVTLNGTVRRPPLAIFPHPGLPNSSRTTTSCAMLTGNSLRTSIIPMTRSGDRRPSCSRKMRREGLQLI